MSKLSIIGEPTNSKICCLSKSCFEYEVNIIGKSCHSSNPKLGVNANYIGARIILYIEKLCYKFKDTTITSNIINGGEKVNIVSNNCKLDFDIRTKKVKYIAKIVKKIQKYAKKLEKMYFGAKITFVKKLSILPLEDNKSNLIQ